MIWLAIVAVVFVAGGAWLVSRSMMVRGLVAVAGVAAVGGYFLLGKPSMPDEPLRVRLAQIQKQWDEKGPESLRVDEFLALAEQGARDRPKDPGPHLAIGTIMEMAGRTDEAMLAYQSALRRAPDNVDAIKKLADLRFRSTQQVDPVTAALYREWYRKEPTQLRAGYLAGIGAWLEGDKEEAEKIWADVESKSPSPETRSMYLALRQMYGIDPAPGPDAPKSQTPG